MATHQETFSRRIKNELSLLNYPLEKKKSILSGFIRYSGTLSISPQVGIRISSSSATASKFIFSCLKDVYKVQPKLTYTKELRLKKNLVYHIEVSTSALEILEDLEIYKDYESMVPMKMIDNEHLQGFIIGTFLASGQISDPDSGRYFCELAFNSEEEAKAVLNKLTAFKGENEMSFKLIQRRTKYVLYLKKSDQISVFLSYIGAISMMFEFENSRLTRDFFNNDNRLTICEQANYSRALKNGEKNIEDILLLEEKIGDVYFTEKTKVLAELRKENKDASYGELAELATKKGLVVTKSGVVHVFTKFSEDASKLK
jgi:DNA-binding protein WhiA